MKIDILGGNLITLKNCKYLVDYEKIESDVDILIEDDKISEIGKNLPKDDVVIDCEGKVVIPGLINSHTHSAMVLLRGYEDDKPLNEWLKRMWEKEKYIVDEVSYAGSKLAFMEMLENGIVGAIDMYRAFEAARAAKEVNFIEKNGPAMISIFRNFDEFEKMTRKFYREFGRDELIKPVINVHSVYTVEMEDIVKSFELSEELDLDVHIHMSETRKEIFDFMEKFGETPIKYLSKKVNLGRAILVHLGWITNWETNTVKKAVFCPSSNMKLGTGGFFPIDELRHATIGLGTDSAASNNDLDMFREMKIGALKLKDQYWDPSIINAREMFKMTTYNGYKLLGIDGGKIEAGKEADLTILDMPIPNMEFNLYSNLVYSKPKVLYTIVKGKVSFDHEKPFDYSFVEEALNKIYKK